MPAAKVYWKKYKNVDNISLEKKHQLFLRQKELLDTFLEHNAIDKAQYDKSLRDLREKMGEKEEE